jgi:hypothetical protein
MATEIDYVGDSIEVGATREIDQIVTAEIGGWDFSPAPDGERILIISGGEMRSNDSLELFINWPATLETL